MTISIFSTGTAAFANNASATAALGGTSVANDVAVVYGLIRSTVNVTLATPSGYTQDVLSGSSSPFPNYAYHDVVGAGASNPSLVPTGTSAGDVVAALGMLLRGVDPVTPVHNDAGQSTLSANSSTTPIGTPALTVTNNNCLILAMVAYAGNASSFGAFNPNADGNWTTTIAFVAQTFTQSLCVQVFSRLQTTAANISSSTVTIAGSGGNFTAHAILSAYNVAAGSVVFRKTLTLSGLGGRVGTRQLQS
jgi:hypothetical protein